MIKLLAIPDWLAPELPLSVMELPPDQTWTAEFRGIMKG
jgi:hypothetical protein